MRIESTGGEEADAQFAGGFPMAMAKPLFPRSAFVDFNRHIPDGVARNPQASSNFSIPRFRYSKSSFLVSFWFVKRRSKPFSQRVPTQQCTKSQSPSRSRTRSLNSLTGWAVIPPPAESVVESVSGWRRTDPGISTPPPSENRWCRHA